MKTTIDNKLHVLYRATNPADSRVQLEDSLNNLEKSVTTLKISPDKNKIGIDQVRDISGALKLKQGTDWLVVAIFDVHLMTDEAQNHLLKALEESPEHQLFMMSSDSSNTVLSTIVSRVSTINYQPPKLSSLSSAESSFYRASGYSKQSLDKYKEGNDEGLQTAKSWLSADTQSRFQIVGEIKSKAEAQEFISSLVTIYYGMLINSANNQDTTLSTINSLDVLRKTEVRINNNGNLKLNLAQLCLVLR